LPGYLIDQKKVLFLHIPKCGGSSIESALAGQGQQFLYDRAFHSGKDRFSQCSAQHFHASAIDRLFPGDFFDFRFAVVRHPVDRIVSEYRFRRGLRPKTRDVTRAAGLLVEPEDFEPWLEFALGHVGQYPFLFDNHLRAQVEFVDPRVAWFRLEDGLTTVMERLSDVLRCNVQLPEKRKQTSKGAEVAVSEQARARIEAHYAQDMDAFGYQ